MRQQPITPEVKIQFIKDLRFYLKEIIADLQES